jgi:hypothetical protein
VASAPVAIADLRGMLGMISLPFPPWAVAFWNGSIGFVIGIVVALVGAWLYYRRPARTRSAPDAPTEKVPMPDQQSRGGHHQGRQPPPHRDPSSPQQPPPKSDLTEEQTVMLTREVLAAARKAKVGESGIAIVTGSPMLGMDSIMPNEMEPFDPAQHEAGEPIATCVRARHGVIAQVLSPVIRHGTGAVAQLGRVRCYAYTEVVREQPAQADAQAPATGVDDDPTVPHGGLGGGRVTTGPVAGLGLQPQQGGGPRHAAEPPGNRPRTPDQGSRSSY